MNFLKNAINKNLQWFIRSGVMIPYDSRIGSWGGGDLFEGGGGSIYTGWTNAPIALNLLFENQKKSMF
jgi:hypothetical protein